MRIMMRLPEPKQVREAVSSYLDELERMTPEDIVKDQASELAKRFVFRNVNQEIEFTGKVANWADGVTRTWVAFCSRSLEPSHIETIRYFHRKSITAFLVVLEYTAYHPEVFETEEP